MVSAAHAAILNPTRGLHHPSCCSSLKSTEMKKRKNPLTHYHRNQFISSTMPSLHLQIRNQYPKQLCNYINQHSPCSPCHLEHSFALCTITITHGHNQIPIPSPASSQRRCSSFDAVSPLPSRWSKLLSPISASINPSLP